jgi:hypothetical protein
MYIPLWLLIPMGLLIVVFGVWTFLLATGKNPLPFPDPGSRIYTAASPQGKDAVVELLSHHGIKERFQADSSGIRRSIMWDGTIINHAPPEVLEKLGGAVASIGLVATDPAESANHAAEFLRSRGFEAKVVLDAEPAIPIAFVVTNAMAGTVLNFRKHMIHMPSPDPVSR